MPATGSPFGGGSRTPPEVDMNRPSVARVYDAALGGKDNFEVDRRVVEQLRAVSPDSPMLALDNRAWLIRVVRYLAGTVGVDQFIDCGSGLPADENTHEAVHRLNPDAQVVYVDNDPVVEAHGRALLENESAHLVAADIRRPAALFAREDMAKYLDLHRPIGLLHAGILHHVPDEEDPYQVMAGYIAALAPGSYVAVSHFYDPRDGSDIAECARKVEEILLRGELGTGTFRGRDEIARFFTGLELVEPGLVPLAEWWPDGPVTGQLRADRRIMLCGLARKL